MERERVDVRMGGTPNSAPTAYIWSCKAQEIQHREFSTKTHDDAL